MTEYERGMLSGFEIQLNMTKTLKLAYEEEMDNSSNWARLAKLKPYRLGVVWGLNTLVLHLEEGIRQLKESGSDD